MTPQAKAEASFRSEERLRLFVEAVKDYAIYTLDPEGRVTSWNQGAERIKGYAASEIIGNNFSRFFTEEDLQEGKPQQELQIAAEQGQFETEAWRVRKDGSRFWANVVLTAIKDDKGELIGFAKVTRDFTERMRGEEALRRANAELATKIIERVAAEEEARSAYQREVTLRQNEESFRLFVKAVKDYAIYTLDAEGRVTSWNQGAERIKGYTASEIIGKNFSLFFTEEELREGKPQQELEIATEQGQFQAEAWRVRKDGSRFWANVVLTAIKNDKGNLIGFAKVTRDFTERMRVEEALRQANAELAAEVKEREAAEQKVASSERSLRHLSLHLLRTQDEERRRIGRELHDSLGQYLAMLKVNLDSLRLGPNGNGDAIDGQLARCIRLAEDSIKEVRTISYLLYPPMLEEVGLKSAIPWYLEGFSQRSNIQTKFEVDPDFGRMSRDVELALFRVLQESLTNVHRHSGSSTADIRLAKPNGQVILEIKDNGKGIPVKLLEQSDEDWMGALGVGLRGMHERMRQLGGMLEITSTKTGTLVRASVPIEQTVSALGKSA